MESIVRYRYAHSLKNKYCKENVKKVIHTDKSNIVSSDEALAVIYEGSTMVNRKVIEELLYWGEYRTDKDWVSDAAYPYQLAISGMFIACDEEFMDSLKGYGFTTGFVDLTPEQKALVDTSKDYKYAWRSVIKEDLESDNEEVNTIKIPKEESPFVKLDPNTGKIKEVLTAFSRVGDHGEENDDNTSIFSSLPLANAASSLGIIELKDMDVAVQGLEPSDSVAVKISFDEEEDDICPPVYHKCMSVDETGHEDEMFDGYEIESENFGSFALADSKSSPEVDEYVMYIILRVEDILSSPSRGKHMFISCLHFTTEDYGYYY